MIRHASIPFEVDLPCYVVANDASQVNSETGAVHPAARFASINAEVGDCIVIFSTDDLAWSFVVAHFGQVVSVPTTEAFINVLLHVRRNGIDFVSFDPDFPAQETICVRIQELLDDLLDS